MNENKDLERIEKKIDLLFKILLELYVEDIGHPYDFKYLSKFSDEIAILYDLNMKKETHKIQFPNKGELEDKEIELEKIQKEYKEGNYLAKDKENIEEQITQLKEEMKKLKKFSQNREKIEEAITIVNQRVYNIGIYLKLREKLGLPRMPRQSYGLNLTSQYLSEILDLSEKGHNPREILDKLKEVF
ncbi:MAG: hypothetical protein ACFFEN_15765 [Candidatus Thorarchaeota archaeon]